MNKFSIFAFSICMGLFLSVGVISDVEAKRLGGGKSFGSKMFQKKPAKRTSSAPSKAQQQNTAQKQALSKKGGMMGILGGLMIGGMLGALFFGGAFENINFMDILIFGAIAFLLFKLLSRKSSAQTTTANGAPSPVEDVDTNSQYNPETSNKQLRQASDNYASSSTDSSEADAKSDETPENILQTGKIPRSFNQKRFLSGAENVFSILQKAWDNGDLADIRQFCSDEVFAEIQDQIKERNRLSHTEVISLKSELVNVVTSDNSTEATVVFNAELNEDGENTRSQEAWYFIRPDNRNENMWLLDGIQQLED